MSDEAVCETVEAWWGAVAPSDTFRRGKSVKRGETADRATARSNTQKKRNAVCYSANLALHPTARSDERPTIERHAPRYEQTHSLINLTRSLD